MMKNISYFTVSEPEGLLGDIKIANVFHHQTLAILMSPKSPWMMENISYFNVSEKPLKGFSETLK